MTKKTLKAPLLPFTPNTAEEVSSLLDNHGVTYQAIETINWTKDYPYAPVAEFRIAHTSDALLIDYRVTEDEVRAVEQIDGGHVWEDSCCEFFSSPADDGTYYNIECNCIGTLLVAHGHGRDNREMAPQTVMDKIMRYSSLGRKTFGVRSGKISWQLSLIVPYAVYFKHEQPLLCDQMTANFYKCGDKMTQPHFLSWNPIDTPLPDFHRPECFGTLLLAK